MTLFRFDESAAAWRPVRRGHPLRGGFIALALPALALTLLTGISGQSPAAPRPSPAPSPCTSQVAHRLGLQEDPNVGVTEMLEEFTFGVISCERERGEWVCWYEGNEKSPTGMRRACGQPSHLNEALSVGTQIWQVFLHPTFPECMEGQSCWDCQHMGNLTCRRDGYASPTHASPVSPPSAPLSL